MAHITFDNVSIFFPIFDMKSRSLKNRLMHFATGGLLKSDAGGRLTVVCALQSISLSFNPGDRIGIVGHNGAGKSTLLRALNRIYPPTFGEAEIVGKTSSLIDITLGIDPDATGIENIFIRAALLGLDSTFIKSKLDEIVEFSELGEYINLPVRVYSSGMHMRLAFSVATIMQPEILIMDEWLSVGDSSFQQKAEARLHEMINNTEIMVIASHSTALLKDICNRIIWLKNGHILASGTPEEIIDMALC